MKAISVLQDEKDLKMYGVMALKALNDTELCT
jgi:hypothetical protein